MGRKAKKVERTPQQVGALIDEIAQDIEKGRLGSTLEMKIGDAQAELLRLKHVEGLSLVSQIALHLSVAGGKPKMYEPLQKKAQELGPFDATKAGSELRVLAKKLSDAGT